MYDEPVWIFYRGAPLGDRLRAVFAESSPSRVASPGQAPARIASRLGTPTAWRKRAPGRIVSPVAEPLLPQGSGRLEEGQRPSRGAQRGPRRQAQVREYPDHRCRRGRGTSAARRGMNSSGDMRMRVVPSRHALFCCSTTSPAPSRLSRSMAIAGRVMYRHRRSSSLR